ncbi:hypothetical protein BT63DRAFT_453022 [Microthyrium microscopicum]|uniref:WD40 repeat-like protein n=1 Tax=Microthyrium microscopicum TaxID=703497 RepID=A0A6A6UJX1_9PEZI|nr:hypothetical protein BT63DRAFT_453022 [Microthyrium microscopicum]
MHSRWKPPPIDSHHGSPGASTKLPPRAKEVTIKSLGIENGENRFDLREPDAPYFALGRSNLTALSKVYNLYFIAHGSDIFVYRPEFPAPVLGTEPSTYITPPTGSNRSGYMDRRRPDDINHMITEFLGNDEILLLCTDCGSVSFYFIRKIEQFIETNPDTGIDYYPDDADFADSVGVSAWGLSVHRQARKIAVSANSHQVFIFQPALIQPEGDPLPTMLENSKRTEQQSFWRMPPAQTRLEELEKSSKWSTRMINYKFRLPDTGNNIPCVTFCNTSDDPEGRILAVGDITGKTIIWDLNNLSFERWTAHFCDSHSQWEGCTCLEDGRFAHAVWGLYFLDKKAFMKYGFAPRKPGQEEVYDVSKEIDAVPNATRDFHVSNPDAPKYNVTLPSFATQDSDSDSDTGSIYSNTSNDMRPQKPARRRFVWDFSINGNPSLPSCPFMWISSKQIAFHQPRTTRNGKGTAVVMRHPLRQAIYNTFHKYFHVTWWTNRIQRMSLHAFIPELGVLVVASPYGRCAVMSLLQGESKTGGPYYFYRVDWILPTEEEEDQGQRPGYTLMGLAVSPMPGSLGKEESGVVRRWRLMLTYEDYTVLSYEISRPVSGIPNVDTTWL